MQHPTADDLARVPLLADLPAETRQVLAPRFEVEEHAAGHVLVGEGRAGYAFYVLAEGTAAVTQDGQPLRTLGPTDFFGEIAILQEGRRTATVTASGPVTVWVLFGTSFRVLETAEPEVAAALQQAMRERLAAR